MAEGQACWEAGVAADSTAAGFDRLAGQEAEAQASDLQQCNH